MIGRVAQVILCKKKKKKWLERVLFSVNKSQNNNKQPKYVPVHSKKEILLFFVFHVLQLQIMNERVERKKKKTTFHQSDLKFE